MKTHRCFSVILAGLTCTVGSAMEKEAVGKEAAPGIELHVAPGGNDAGAGTASAPFATLERARDEIRAIKRTKGLPERGATVTLSGGTYFLPKTFELTAEDSGTASAPVVYRARNGEEVRISGGKLVTNWKPVSDSAVLERLDPAARRHVIEADLHALGLRDFGEIGGGFGLRSGPGLEIFFNDKPMPISRYPNDGFMKIVNVEGPTEVDVRGTKGCAEAVFTYDDDRPGRWKREKAGWVHGYWFWDWAEQRQRIESIDVAAKRMTLAKPFHGYGYRQGQWFYGFNLLCEIDRPGEWYLDRQSSILYFWPPSPIEQGQATVSVLENLITMKNATHVTLRGLTLEAARNTAVIVNGASENRLVGCTLRNLGSWAVSISGVNSGVVGCDIYATGDGGISLNGGNRTTLSPAGLYAENNHIHDWSRWNRMNRHGIGITGVGNRASHNLLHHSPHSAINFQGNDHVIEFNEIHTVCTEANDAGAIYAGRNWTMRGTVIRHNYLHHLSGYKGRSCMGVYLDDMYSGTTIFGNLFFDVTRAVFIGGGHNNHVENNVLVNCQPAVHVDSRGLDWAHNCSDDWVKEIREKGTLSGIRYDKPPYSARYPMLARILEQDPAAPTGTAIDRNVCWGGRWDDIDKQALPFVTLRNNLLDTDPLFVDAASEHFQLRDNSPAYKLGFQRIPMEKFGLVNDGTRASWPVTHQVQPRE